MKKMLTLSIILGTFTLGLILIGVFTMSQSQANHENTTQSNETNQPLAFSVIGLEKYGVQLVAYGDAEFNVLTDNLEIASEVKDLILTEDFRKHFVFVKNESERRIIGLTVRFDFVHQDGMRQVFNATLSPSEFLFNDGRRIIKGNDYMIPLSPGETRVFTYNDIFSVPLTKKEINESDRRNLSQAKVSYQDFNSKLKSIQITLDGVFFEGGDFYGENKSFSFEDNLAQVEAEIEFYQRLRDLTQNPNADYEAFVEEMRGLHVEQPRVLYGSSPSEASEAYELRREYVLSINSNRVVQGFLNLSREVAVTVMKRIAEQPIERYIVPQKKG